MHMWLVITQQFAIAKCLDDCVVVNDRFSRFSWLLRTSLILNTVRNHTQPGHSSTSSPAQPSGLSLWPSSGGTQVLPLFLNLKMRLISWAVASAVKIAATRLTTTSRVFGNFEINLFCEFCRFFIVGLSYLTEQRCIPFHILHHVFC